MTVLRTGAEVPEVVIRPVLLSLEHLAGSNPIALHELVQLAREPSHRLFGKTASVLLELTLLEPGGTLHDVTRDVVLAAAEGDGLELRLRSPYAEQEAR